MIHFGHIELFVQNPLKSMEFYRDVLGFEVIAIQHEQLVWMQSGTMAMLLRPGENSTKISTYQQAAAGLVLYTDNLSETVRELEARGLVFKGTDGSSLCLTFTDPDGNWFQLVNPHEH